MSNVIVFPVRRVRPLAPAQTVAEYMASLHEHSRREGYGDLPEALAAKLERHIAKRMAAKAQEE